MAMPFQIRRAFWPMYRFLANGKWPVWRLAFEQKSLATWPRGMPPDSNVPGKSTMNEFAIASPEELREDMLGSSRSKTQKSFTAEYAGDAKKTGGVWDKLTPNWDEVGWMGRG